jgi:metal-responsive CopG/Arc/MetJ family transcriptional regulator
MPARAVQVSIDDALLKRIDRDRETREKGRSAFIRSAVQLYLKAKERGQVDVAIRKAYEGEAEAMLDDVRGLMEAQAWRDR